MKKMMRRTAALMLALVMILSMVPGVSAAALKQGSQGSDVKRLQQNLIGLGSLTGAADGNYGSNIRKAVENFQYAFGLTVDGIAGEATSAAIRNAVVRIQVELKKLGYAPGSADGVFGNNTRNALLAFQKDNGLPRTGCADKDTWAVINATTGGMRADVAVRPGSFGTSVTYLQQALIGLGYLTGSADGHYGPRTQEAVRGFQRTYGLSVDGSAGKNTMTALKNAIAALQSDLVRKGYLSGSIDGIYGNGTRNAVKAYQNACGITASGVVNSRTMEKLCGYSLGTADVVVEKTYKIWIDSLFQDGDFSKISYGGGRYSTTVAESGCGGVSMAMALNALLNTDRYTGQNVMQWYVNNGYYWGKGTSHDGIYKYPRTLGLTTEFCGKASQLTEHLKKGCLAIALIRDKSGQALFTKYGGGGHYILISGYRVMDGTEQIFVNNPLSTKDSRWFDLKDLMANVYNASEGYPNPIVVIHK